MSAVIISTQGTRTQPHDARSQNSNQKPPSNVDVCVCGYDDQKSLPHSLMCFRHTERGQTFQYQ